MGSWWNWRRTSMKVNAGQETHPKYWCRLKNESCGWQHKVKMFWTNIRKQNKKTTGSWCAIHTFTHAFIHTWKKEREQSFVDLLSENKQTKKSLSNGCKVIFAFVQTFSFTGDIHWTYISLFYFSYCWSFSFDLFVDAFVCVVNPKYMCNERGWSRE